VPVIGDGSMTAGMAFEALNHAGELGLKNLIVVLNDNEMSIAPNVGAMSWFFSKSVTGKLSTRARAKFKRLHKDGYIPDLVYQAIDRAEEMTQGFISSAALLFEAFGFRYIGPVDGHSVADLLEAFENAKQQDVPVLVHVSTLKGKGFEPAEADPWSWHATKPFIPEKLQDLNDDVNSAKLQLQLAPTYTEVFADSLIRLANKDPKIVAITAAMPDGTGLDIFQKVHPDKFYDVGICEQHAVTFAAGLSCEGYKPVCAIYSTFLQRGYDQVVHDVCLQNLPVIFALDRAGVVGNDGETHQGIFDLAYLRALPNICIMAAKDENELQNMLATAVDYPGPIAVRYPRGNGFGVKCDDDFVKMEIGKAEVVFSAGNSLLFIAFGTTVYTALAVAEMLATEYGIKSTVVNARFLKPLDEELLSREMLKTNYVVTIEDHAVEAGFGSAVLEFAARAQLNQDRKFDLYGVQNTLVTHASQVEQQVLNGYDQHSILKNVLKNFGASVFEQAASPV
jgi:1-deoxy-D-xylulose-5-phosphate synthase